MSTREIDGVEILRLVNHGRMPSGLHCYGAQRANDGAWRWVWLTDSGTFDHWSRGFWHLRTPGGPSDWRNVS